MLMIPIHDHEKRETTLVFVLQKDNVERMKKADPVTLKPMAVGGYIPYLPYPQHVSITIAYEGDTGKLLNLYLQEGAEGLIKHLERGYEFKPGIDGIKTEVIVPVNKE